MPRFLDDPMKRVGDIYSAVDYLISLRYVDAWRTGALGNCAGSGTAVDAVSNAARPAPERRLVEAARNCISEVVQVRR